MSSNTIHLLLGKIVAALETEASLLLGVRGELESIKRELACMTSFLTKTSKIEEKTEQEETWVAQVREKSAEVEDIIDEFLYYEYKKQWHGRRFLKFTRKIIRYPEDIWRKHDVAKKFQKIKKDVEHIRQQNMRYGVESIETSNSREIHRGVQECRELARFTDQRDLVGMQDQIGCLSMWLMRQNPELMVISVVGMGGSGKTTLVGQIYNDENIRSQFQCYAWITVSKTYRMEELIKKTISEFYHSCHEIVPCYLGEKTLSQLVELLLTYLNERKFLLVLDDVWDVQLWDKIKLSLPNCDFGSRVVLTTRNEAVANLNYGMESCVHNIRQLNNEEAWELFCKNAFSSDLRKHCPPDFEDLAHKLVKKCGRLPLAVKTLGGLLYSKKSKLEWKNIYNSLDHQLKSGLMPVKIILSLGLNDLPFRLKVCFLYCCIFPEDQHIWVGEFNRLWIAEGFVEQIRGLALEIVAEGYLHELVARNMLEIFRKTPLGRVITCKMHDLMRELAMSTAEEENFCFVCEQREPIKDITRARISILAENEILSFSNMSYVRSFHVFTPKISSQLSCGLLPSGFKLLRILCLRGFPIDKLPNEFGTLFKLRYLNLAGTQVRELPQSIGRLHNLQSVDIRETNIKALPKEISKLVNLRHLLGGCSNKTLDAGFRSIKGVHAPSNIFKFLTKLQVLTLVEIEGDMIKQFGKVNQLTRLGISNVKSTDEQDLCYIIQQMKFLRCLTLLTINEDEFLRMSSVTLPPYSLEAIKLYGKLETVPLWLPQLQNLTYLKLARSQLENDPLPYVQVLPNLGRLILIGTFSGIRLWFKKGFPKLESLRLAKFHQLEEVIIEEGAMRKLATLEVVECKNLKKLPEGIEHLENLRVLNLKDTSEELVDSIQQECSSRLQHISQINYWRQAPSGICEYQNLSTQGRKRR